MKFRKMLYDRRDYFLSNSSQFKNKGYEQNWSSCLENPMNGGAWQAAVHGVDNSRTPLSNLTFTFPCIGEGNGNPLQCSCLENPRDGGAWCAAVYGVTESDTTEVTQQQQQQQYISSSFILKTLSPSISFGVVTRTKLSVTYLLTHYYSTTLTSCQMSIYIVLIHES